MKFWTAFLLTITLNCVPDAALAQSPYELSWGQDLGLGAGGLGLYLGGRSLKSSVKTLNEAGLRDYNSADINAFDRFASRQNSAAAATASDVSLNISILPMFALLIDSSMRADVLTIGVMALEVATITEGLSNISKTTVLRERPIVYKSETFESVQHSPEARLSFFSSHTANSAAYSFFAAKVFSDYYPDSDYGSYVWIAAFTLPAITGMLRVAAGKHFPSDVISAYVVGGLIGYFVPQLHRRSQEQAGLSLAASFGDSALVCRLTVVL